MYYYITSILKYISEPIWPLLYIEVLSSTKLYTE